MAFQSHTSDRRIQPGALSVAGRSPARFAAHAGSSRRRAVCEAPNSSRIARAALWLFPVAFSVAKPCIAGSQHTEFLKAQALQGRVVELEGRVAA